MSATVLAEQNKVLARRFREDLWKQGNLALADEICDKDATLHTNDPLTPDFGRGPNALKQIVSMYLKAFPDATNVIDDFVIEGNKIVMRWTGRGTHKGMLGNIAPTNKQVTVTGIDICYVSNGKIKEVYTEWNSLGLLKQLGINTL